VGRGKGGGEKRVRHKTSPRHRRKGAGRERCGEGGESKSEEEIPLALAVSCVFLPRENPC